MFLLRLFSRLPWWLLYFLADVARAFTYYIIRYRRKVVRENLRQCFPEWDEVKLASVEREYYLRFFDFMVETFKCQTISEEEFKSRFSWRDADKINQVMENEPIIILTAHIFNWEMQGVSVGMHLRNQSYFSYQKLKSPFFDQFMRGLRGRFGGIGMLRNETARGIIRHRKENALFYLVADQAPIGVAKRYRTLFFGRNTAFYHGVGQIVQATGIRAYAARAVRVKRGRYELGIVEICPPSSGLSAEEILERYVSYLEESIRLDPPSWLWSHKRWKTGVREDDILSKRLVEHGQE